MPNRLQHETSPYLLQHANNPVDWYPWGDAAFDKAKREHKPVLVSIGYAACHWCHVMEHESFEDPDVAALMNEHFVCIKVDREEHPDVDHLYMDALQAMTGAGGWPLNMFVTPDRKPFYGGTYFPPQSRYGRASWKELLVALHRAWEEKQDEIILQSEQMLQHLQQASVVVSAPESEQVTGETIKLIVQNLLQQADTEWGGFGGAPKFPSTGAIRFLLEFSHFHEKQDAGLAAAALRQALLSLDKMIEGGIYDHLGGGFARYATDREWLVPHFEKMLYDNALLVSVLSSAYRITRNDRYRRVIAETIGFCRRELGTEAHPGFYCALDADSEGEEGKFYTWTWADWQTALPEAHPALTDYFGIRPEGNWEATNILHAAVPDATIQERYRLDAGTWASLLGDARERLFRLRSGRIRPATDHKMLLSWNALMNIALTDAALALGEESWQQEAVMHMEWMLSVFRKGSGACSHVYTQGEARIPAKLDDYAYLIQALCRLASATGAPHYIPEAEKLMHYTNRHFLTPDGRFYYFSSDEQQDIVVRKTELYDGATPSGNSVMMENLQVLGSIAERGDWLAQAHHMMLAMKQTAVRYPVSFSCWAVYLQQFRKGRSELVIAGPDALSLLKEWQGLYYPQVFAVALTGPEAGFAAGRHKFVPGRNLFYLCSGFSCLPPESTFEGIQKHLDGR